MNARDWLTLAAFVLALAAFVTNTTLSWLRWPCVVINTGAEPFTICTIGLMVVNEAPHQGSKDPGF